ncbi:MAG: RNA polymerase sigma factor [Gammaproteobacteria bacterium]|nr:RNA polymerase sigma factor [Gammaproteobacteria bacterium]MBP6051450.1 RNA polymerase sigma factor [Pseudomonadales bacterium]MBK6582778.1 RNA polymerase sigma factor [Gammaproteobacteria bacterium]MBK7171269.1 RNA polymerase sigma factor [Gammaproteobacteria bacterium]MBK7518907.1 RNA polymerase sigma factor [Gammaproteobacteria bacterium]
MAKRPGEVLEQLITRHGSALVRFLSRKLGSVDDAEEIAQDAFLRLHRLENTDNIDNARAFLFQVASNMAIDQLRRRRLHARYVADESGRLNDETEPQTAATPEALVTAREQVRLVFQAIEQMPLRPRQALMLHRVKGLSYAEIAREMGVSVSSVEKYILEALKHCRSTMVP